MTRAAASWIKGKGAGIRRTPRTPEYAEKAEQRGETAGTDLGRPGWHFVTAGMSSPMEDVVEGAGAGEEQRITAA